MAPAHGYRLLDRAPRRRDEADLPVTIASLDRHDGYESPS
jgi:hypothetical protein